MTRLYRFNIAHRLREVAISCQKSFRAAQSPKRGMGADRRAEEREPPLGSDPIPKQEDGAGLAMDIMSRTSAALCPFF